MRSFLLTSKEPRVDTPAPRTSLPPVYWSM
mgnify:CR=1 FL=1